MKNPLNNGLYFGCDMLEFRIKDLRKNIKFSDYGIEIIWNIDTDNSSNAFCELFEHIFTYRKAKISGNYEALIFSTSIDNISVDLFALLEAQKSSGPIQSRDKVVFYSTLFVVENLGKLNFSVLELYNFFFEEAKPELHRLDVCLDISADIKELNQTIFKNLKFHSQIGDDKKHPEFYQTYYIKNPQSSINRSYIIRIYDKVLDTFRKGKGFLYPHLSGNSDVRRLELEIRTKECERLPYSIQDILTNKNYILQSIYLDYINKNINEDYVIDTLVIIKKNIPNKKTDLRSSYMEYEHIPPDYFSRSYGYIKKIRETIGYEGLISLLINNKKSEGSNLPTDYITNADELIHALLTYIQKENIFSQRKLNQILKSFIPKKPKKIKKIL